MKKSGTTLPLLLLALLVAVAGCGKKHSASDGHGHAEGKAVAQGEGHGEEGHEHEEASGAEFKEGAGIQLGDEAREAIGLETTEVAEQKLALEFPATARVFHAAHQHGNEFPGHKDGHAYANAIIPSAVADRLQVGQKVLLAGSAHAGEGRLEGRLSSLDRETTRAIGQVEAVIEIPDADEHLQFGAFLTARFAGTERIAMVIPRSALVDAATGTFVYAQNGERWLRTPVKAGGANENFVEILDGLIEGDVVVSKGASDLWLIELRFTKGGGHSH
jgi:multidrug efflux pump subunit AcrA (membrane-fusion protein)